MFFVILVTHLKSYIETTDRHDFGGKPSKWRWRRVLSWKIPEFCSVGGARSKKNIFSRFMVPFDYPAHSLRETVLPQTNGTDGKPHSEGVLLLVWRVCDQTFGRYRPWRVPKSGHVTIMHKNWKFAYSTYRKIHWFQKCYSFRSMTKNNGYRGKLFQNRDVTRRFAVLNWRSSSMGLSSCICMYVSVKLINK